MTTAYPTSILPVRVRRRPELKGMEQLGLFEVPAPAQLHSAPSVAAAARIEPVAKSLRAAVLGFIRGRGPAGATDEEICTALIPTDSRLKDGTLRARRVELVRAELVRDSGSVRDTRSGRTATVWLAAGE